MIIVLTRKVSEKPGADNGRNRLSGFPQQRRHAEEQCRGGRAAFILHVILINEVSYHQVEKVAGSFGEYSVAVERQGGGESGKDERNYFGLLAEDF